MPAKFYISVDLEEYFHAANLQISPENYKLYPSRVKASTNKLLDIFAANKTSATFFCLSSVAEQHPELIRKIARSGHTIASHGHSHRSVFKQTEQEFYQEVVKSKTILEDICGQAVTAYRAPNFSITSQTPWAYPLLAKAGYLADSSLHPIRHDRFNNSQCKRTRYQDRDSALEIFPIATKQLFGQNLPIGGGAYWRLMPLAYAKWGLRNSGLAQNYCYLHPWELDPEQTRIKFKFSHRYARHYIGQATFARKLDQLLKTFSFQNYDLPSS